MTLKDKLKDNLFYLGNRVATLGRVAILTGTLAFALNPPKPTINSYQYYAGRFNTEITDPYTGKIYSPISFRESADQTLGNLKNVGYGIGLIGIIFAGTSGILMTANGKTTKRIYERTKEYIGSRGQLEPEFVEQVIKGSENAKYFGYCELQGVYLAARETGNLEVFNKVKRKYSKIIIPNF